VTRSSHHHIDALAAFQADPDTDAIVMIARSAATPKNAPADFIKANVTKPSSATSPASPPRRQRPWATPAPSSPAPPAPQG